MTHGFQNIPSSLSLSFHSYYIAFLKMQDFYYDEIQFLNFSKIMFCFWLQKVSMVIFPLISSRSFLALGFTLSIVFEWCKVLIENLFFHIQLSSRSSPQSKNLSFLNLIAFILYQTVIYLTYAHIFLDSTHLSFLFLKTHSTALRI